jgi:hypothetical protein
MVAATATAILNDIFLSNASADPLAGLSIPTKTRKSGFPTNF